MTLNDAAELHQLLRPPDSDAPGGVRTAASLQELRARIRRWESRRSPDGDEVWLNWTLRLKPCGTVVGRMQATVTEAWADMAWVIGRRYRNRGYATEAARSMAVWLREFFHVREVRASIHPDNAASQRVATKIGMSRSGERTDEGEEIWTHAPLTGR